MNRYLTRCLILVSALAALVFSAGCAEFAQGLAQAAEQMRQDRQNNPYGDYYQHTPANASASGIK